MSDLYVEARAYQLEDQILAIELALQLPPASNMHTAKSRLRVGQLVTHTLTVVWDGLLPFSPKSYIMAGGRSYSLTASGDNWVKYDHHMLLGEEHGF